MKNEENAVLEINPTPIAAPCAIAPNSPAAMMMSAMSQGASLEQIEKMMDLQDRWERKEAEKAYNVSFAAFKDEAVKIVKNRQVTDGPLKGKSYAELFSVVNAVTPALSKHGLSASWKLTKDEKDWIEVTCVLKHQLGHAECVSMGGPPDIGGAKNAIMARASTISYLERYTLKAICGLAEQGDDDDAGNGRRDVDAATDDDPLVQEGQAQSMEGTKALTAWWAALKEADRKRLTPHFGPMKRAAAAADKDRR